jgi:hypothetical protein
MDSDFQILSYKVFILHIHNFSRNEIPHLLSDLLSEN